MNEHSLDGSTDPPDLLENALADYCDRLDRGFHIDREEFLSQCSPAIQDELRQCLNAFEFIHEVAPTSYDSHKPLPVGDIASEAESPKEGLFRLGDFEVIRELGRGGMGVVYEGEQISLKRRVAIKVLPFAGLLDRRNLERFRNEARAAAMLKHPNIVSVVSIGFERGTHFYVMELVEGCNLAAVIRGLPDSPASSNGEHQPSRLNASRDIETTQIAALSTQRSSNRQAYYRSVARLGIQAASALHAAHESGVVHRDIKPSNLLLDQDGQLLVADFGLARIQSDQGITMTGDLVGTLRYMSPEQIEASHPVDHRSDIYSLGVTLHELIAGQPAFPASAKAKLVSDILLGESTVLRSDAKDVPRDLDTVIRKAMAVRTDDRYQNSLELQIDLQRFLDGKPVQARRASTAEVFVRWCKRNRSKATLLALTTCTLVAMAVLGPLLALRESSKAREQMAIAARQRHEAYDAHMARAYEHVQHGEIEHAARLLRKYIPDHHSQPDFRNFEWRYLAQECQEGLNVETIAYARAFTACELSPDRNLLAAATWNGTVRVFNASSGHERWKDDGHGAEVFDVRFTKDGNYLLSASFDKKVIVWDAHTGGKLLTKALPGWPRAIDINSENLLAVGIVLGDEAEQDLADTPCQLQLLQLVEGRDGPETIGLTEIASSDSFSYARKLQFSPNGSQLAIAGEDGFLRVLETATLKQISNFEVDGAPATCVAFSPDGAMIAAGSADPPGPNSGGHVVVWDVGAGEKQSRFGSEPLRDIAFIDKDRVAAATDNGTLQIWSVSRGELHRAARIASNRLNGIAVSIDGDRIFVACEDNRLRSVRISPQTETSQPNGFPGGFDVAFSPQGDVVAFGSTDGKLRTFDVRTGEAKAVLPAHSLRIWAAAFSCDGTRLASVAAPYPLKTDVDPQLTVYDPSTGQQIFQVALEGIKWPRSIQFAPATGELAIVADGKLLFWDVEKEEETRRLKFGDGGGRGFAVDFSRDGRYVGCVTSHKNAGIRIWEYPSLKPVVEQLNEQPPYVWGFAIDSAGKRYAAADHVEADYAVSVYGIPDSRRQFSLFGHTDYVTSIDFSPDDKRLITSSKDGTVILWNLETGGEIIRFRNHPDWVWQTRFSPHGDVIGSAHLASDGTSPLILRRTLSLEDATNLLKTTEFRSPVNGKSRGAKEGNAMPGN